MIKQTDDFFRVPLTDDKDALAKRMIHLYGCYFMCINELIDKKMRHHQVIEIYYLCVKAGVMGANCFVNDPNGVAKVISKHFGHPKSIKQIGWVDTKEKAGVLPPDVRIVGTTHRHVTANKDKYGAMMVHFTNTNYDPYQAGPGVYPMSIIAPNIQHTHWGLA